MKLTINGRQQDSVAATVAELVEELGMKKDRVAVELNRGIVPRDQWAATQLAHGDQLEIVQFVGGGTPSRRGCPAGRREGLQPFEQELL
jgi:sulfur carrier protein